MMYKLACFIVGLRMCRPVTTEINLGHTPVGISAAWGRGVPPWKFFAIFRETRRKMVRNFPQLDKISRKYSLWFFWVIFFYPSVQCKAFYWKIVWETRALFLPPLPWLCAYICVMCCDRICSTGPATRTPSKAMSFQNDREAQADAQSAQKFLAFFG